MGKFLKKMETSVLNKRVFLLVYMVVCLLYFMPSTLNISNIPMKICFIWSLLLLGYDFIFKRDMFKPPYARLLFGIAILFLGVVLINAKFSLVNGGYNFIYLSTAFFVIYPSTITLSVEEKKKFLYLFNNVFIVIVMLAALVSVIEFLFIIAYKVPTGTPGLLARQGFMESRLFGVYTSPNMGAMFGFISVVMVVINKLLVNKPYRLLNIVYIVNLVVQIIYYFLASSRGTQVAVSAFLAVLLVVVVTNKRVKQDFSKLYNHSVGSLIVTILLLLVVLNVGASPIKKALGYIPPTFSHVTGVKVGYNFTNLKEENITADEKKIKIEHSEEGSELSSGRFNIWKSAVEVIKQRPLVGFADINFYRSGSAPQLDEKKLSPLAIKEMRRVRGNMHNGYLQVLVTGGVFVFVLVMSFYVIAFIKLFISYYNGANDFSTFSIFLNLVMFSLLVSFFACDLVESHILFNNRDVIGLVFWFYLGILTSIKTKSESL